MKTVKVICAIAALVVVGLGQAAAQSSTDVAALQAADQTWLKAYNTGDVETIVGLYDEQGVLLPPGAPAAKGRPAIRGYFARETADAAKAGISFSLGPAPSGGVSGDMGWQSGTYTVKDKSGRVLDAGKYLSVSAKKGGKWLYTRDTWNSDMAPAAAASAPAAKK